MSLPKPFERDDASLKSIVNFKGCVITDERRTYLEDYVDLEERLSEVDE